MDRLEILYNKLIEEWRLKAKGRGIINFGPKVPYNPVILGILQQVYVRDPTSYVLIITDSFATRDGIINYITNSPNKENNSQFSKLITSKHIIIATKELLANWRATKTIFYLGITIGINKYSSELYNALIACKFKLVGLTADCSGKERLYDICTLVGQAEVNELEKLVMNTPVEEHQIGLIIENEADLSLINKYTEYITQSIQIFGSFERLNLAKNGDPNCNVSSTEICNRIAMENGWNENLDMSYDFNKSIDACYNPIALQERVELTYDIIRKRTKLVSENSVKLETILQICQDNPAKRILIINKSADFAKLVTAYLNEHIVGNSNGKRFFDACYNYHDNLDKIYALDDNGNKILVKSGASKGEPKMLASGAQMSMAENYINRGLTYILSTNNAPNKKLNAEIDLVIITSSLCESFESYKYRLNYVAFTSNPIIVYQIYCLNTIEEKELEKQKPTINHTIIKNVKKEVNYDENLGVIVAY